MAMTDRDRAEVAFNKGYQDVADRAKGAFLPREAAPLIAAELSETGKVDDVFAGEILRVLHSPEVKSTIYAGAFEGLRDLLERGHVVTIWTQGDVTAGPVAVDLGQMIGSAYQIRKIYKAGIQRALGDLWRRQVKDMGMPRVIGGIDKHQVLGEWVEKFKAANLRRVVVVDDKVKNLKMAREILARELGDGIQVECRLCVAGADDVEAGEFPVIRQLTELVEEGLEKTAFLIDLDYTIIDHGQVRRNFVDRIATLVSARHGE